MTRHTSRLTRLTWKRAGVIACSWPLTLTLGCASLPSHDISLTGKTANTHTLAPSRAGSITAADLRSVNALSTLDAVRQLHPDFLRPSLRWTGGDPTKPSVYVDRTFLGDASWLASIPIAEVRDITFLRPTEAHFRFGPACPCAGGVIQVHTNPRGAR